MIKLIFKHEKPYKWTSKYVTFSHLTIFHIGLRFLITDKRKAHWNCSHVKCGKSQSV